MYKCDLCYGRLRDGKTPTCLEACPNDAILFGTKSEMRDYAYARAKETASHIYGEEENGGTSTFYVSPVPFESIDSALKKQKQAH